MRIVGFCHCEPESARVWQSRKNLYFMELIIVRHGETFENRDGISQGHLNSQLTPKGVEQVKKIAQRLKDTMIDIAFTSDLDRASDTCKEILKFHEDVIPVVTPVLREQAKGIFEGKTKQERSAMYKKEGVPFYEWHPEGGERLTDVWDKVIRLIETIRRDNPDKNVLLVSHGGPISCMLAYLHGKGIESVGDYVPKENTAISIVDIEDKKVAFDVLNCSAHL